MLIIMSIVHLISRQCLLGTSIVAGYALTLTLSARFTCQHQLAWDLVICEFPLTASTLDNVRDKQHLWSHRIVFTDELSLFVDVASMDKLPVLFVISEFW